MPEIFSKWFWLLAIGVTFLNGGIFWVQSRKEVKESPELEDGYRTLIKGFVMWTNIPWVVMGIGCLVGGVPSVFHYFRPRDGNLWVLAFFASVVLLWLLGTFWLFFRGGAEMLAKHPGFFHPPVRNPRLIKLFWFVCLAGGVLGVVVMVTLDIPLPSILNNRSLSP